MSATHDALKDGRKHKITREDYDYFLDVLPPVCLRLNYQGETWDFGFAEGADCIRLFKKQGDEYFAVETPYLNPYEAGSIESQTKRWILKWVELGNQNLWIREAHDPPFNTQSFHECNTDRELLEKFQHGNWCLGQAFHVGNLCFIQQVDAGDEWLTIKEGMPFESISFGHIIKDDGLPEAQKLIEDIRAASVEQCRKLEYMGR